MRTRAKRVARIVLACLVAGAVAYGGYVGWQRYRPLPPATPGDVDRGARAFMDSDLGSKDYGSIPRAVYELESAVLCPGRPKEKADAHAQLAETYSLVPNRPAAQKHAALARKLDPENARLKKLKL